MGRPRSASRIEASRKRLMPAINSCATANEIALTRCAPGPNRRSMNSGTDRTLEP